MSQHAAAAGRGPSWSRAASLVLGLTLAAAAAPFGVATAQASAESLSSPILLASAGSPGAVGQPEWTFTTESATECSFGSSPEAPVWTACTSPFRASAPQDGTYVFQVRARQGDETSSSTTSSYVRDTTATVQLEVPASPSSNRTPTWALQVEAGATARCALDAVALEPCGAGFQGDLTDAADGPHLLTVQVLDALGNRTTQISPPYVLDTTVPAQPRVAASMDVRTGRFTWNIAAEDKARLTCQLLSDGVPGTTFACTSSQALTLPGEGVYALRVSQTDPAGNISPTTESAPTSTDTRSPGRPIVTGPVGPASDRAPAWSVSAEPDAVLSCRLLREDGVRIEERRHCGPSVSFTLPTDGSYLVEAVTTDASGLPIGEVGVSLPYELDTTPPAIPVVSGPSGVGSDPAPRWTVSAGDLGDTLSCTFRAPDQTRLPVLCGASGVTVDALVQDGPYVLDVRTLDPSGNVGATATVRYVLDTVSPVVRDVRLVALRERDRVRSLTWSFVPEAGVGGRLVCTLTYEAEGSGTPVPELSRDCPSSPFTVQLDAGWPDGTYRFAVRQTDEAGNVGVPSVASYTLDTTPPARSTLTEEPLGPSRGAQVAWRLAPDAAAVSRVCTLRRGTEPLESAACDEGVSAWNLEAFGEGDYVLGVSASDDLGNVSLSTSRPYTYDLASPDPLVWDSYPGSTLPFPLAEPGETGSLGHAAAAAPFLFHSEPGTTFTCRLARGVERDNALLVAARPCDGATPGAGRFVLGPVNASTRGTYWLTVTVHQTGYREREMSAVSFVLDLEAPGAPVFTRGEGSGSDARPHFTWARPAAEVDEQYVALCRLVPGAGNAESAGPMRPCPGNSYDEPLTRPGLWSVEVRFVDRAGRQGPSNVSPTYRYDLAGPERPDVLGPTRVSAAVTTLVSWFFQPPTDVARVTCRLTRNGTDVVAVTVCPEQVFTQDLASQPPGDYELTVTYETQAGARSYTKNPFAFAGRDVEPPTPDVGVAPGDLERGGGTGDGKGEDNFQANAAPDQGPGPSTLGPTTPPASDDQTPRTLLPSADGQEARPNDPPATAPADAAPVPTPGSRTLPAEPPRPGRVAVDPPDEVLATSPDPSRILVPGVPGALDRMTPPLVGGGPARPALPLALVVTVVLFLLVHNRIDRRDPKLSGAPLVLEPDLEFGPAMRATPTPPASDPRSEPRSG